ncbi:MAG: hypothetical protein PF503_17705 [Desulfobacula sp.]|nr:hypothetical protein [Desulfobacula sp.]
MKHRIILYTVILFLILLSNLSAGTNFIGWYAGDWDAYYQNSGATAVIQTQDNGFAVVGNTNSCQNSPYCTMGYVAKINSSGSVEWSTVIGSEEFDVSTYMAHLAETNDGGVAVVGRTEAGGIGSLDMVIIKYNSQGRILWQRVYGHSSLAQYPYRIYDNNDGTITVMAEIVKPGCHECPIEGSPIFCTTSTFTKVVINSQTGAIVEEINLNNSKKGYKVSTGLITLPEAVDTGRAGRSLNIMKFSTTGFVEWSKVYWAKDSEGGHVNLSNFLLAEISDGYLVNANGYDSIAKESLLYQFKINFQGELQWMKAIKVYEGKSHNPNDVVATSDGYAYVSLSNGYSTVENTIVKTNTSNGSIVWAKQFGTKEQLITSIAPSSSGFVAAGTAQRLQLISFDNNGELGNDCESFNILSVNATASDADYFVDPGAGPRYCLDYDLTSAVSNLVYASNTFTQKDVCTGISGEGNKPLAVTLVSPNNAVSNPVSFTWNADSASTWYKFWVGTPSGSKVFAQWYDAAEICSGGNCSVSPELELAGSDYEWYVKSWNGHGRIWSDGMAFTIQNTGTPPSKITHTSPSEATQDSTPTYTWAKDSDTTYYKLWVGYPNGDKVFSKWYAAGEICYGSSCSVTPDADLTNGNYEWYVKSWNADGRVWSDGMGFTITGGGVPTPGETCGSGYVYDCVGNCVDVSQTDIGDGYCDDGTYGYVLTCSAFNNDGGDCEDGSPGESCGSGLVYDCTGNCVDTNTANDYIGDGDCDDGTYGYVLTCSAFNNDGGDCE